MQEYPLPNVWLGVSVEDQKNADHRIPFLLQAPAKVRFLSCEPLIGSINIGLLGTAPKDWGYEYVPIHSLLHWVIVGGESGHSARPVDPQWVRQLRDECKDGNVAFFFKQWGEYAPAKEGAIGAPSRLLKQGKHKVSYQVTNGDTVLVKVGKKAAGNLLDGEKHLNFPFE